MRLTNTGFSLIAVILVATAVSGLALILANLKKQKSRIQRKVNVHFEVENISNTVLRVLYDSQACTHTLGKGSTITNGRAIPSIKNSNGGTMFNTVKKYGNKTILFESITLDQANINNPSSGTVNLKVVFKKTDQEGAGYDTVVKKFPLSLDLDSARKLVKCYSNHQFIMNMVVNSSCDQVGGAFHPETGKCIPAALNMASQNFCKGIGTTYTNARCDMESIKLKTIKTACKSLNGTYQNSIQECVLPPSP